MLAAVLGVVVLGLALALLFKRQVPLLLSSPPLKYIAISYYIYLFASNVD